MNRSLTLGVSLAEAEDVSHGHTYLVLAIHLIGLWDSKTIILVQDNGFDADLLVCYTEGRV